MTFIKDVAHSIQTTVEHIPPMTKHATDFVAALSGIGLPIAWFLEKIASPIISIAVGTITFVWIYYRIKEIRKNIGDDK